MGGWRSGGFVMKLTQHPRWAQQVSLRLVQVVLANHGGNVGIDHGHVSFLLALGAPLTGPLNLTFDPASRACLNGAGGRYPI